jgi:hypothetical protein
LEDDILPPIPPGQENVYSEDGGKKSGLFSKLFSKKKQEALQPVPQPPPFLSEPPKPAPDVPQDINLDNIRKQLGLQPISDDLGELAEPPKIAQKGKKPEPVGMEKKLFDFTVPEPEKIEEKKKPVFVDEDAIEEPPKIKGKTDWTSDISVEPKIKKESEFIKEAKPDVEKIKAPAKSEFATEVKPEDVKKLAIDLKRQTFEKKKGISYEPEVYFDNEHEDDFKRSLSFDSEKESFSDFKKIEEAIKDSVEEEPIPIYTRTKAESEGKDKTKHEHEHKHGHINHEHKHVEHAHQHVGHEHKHIEHETKHSEPHRTLVDAERDLREKLTEKIRAEQRELLKKEYDEQKKELEKELSDKKKLFEKEKQEFEQEKIALAGKAHKYDFREKQLNKDREGLKLEREELEKDHELLRAEKREFHKSRDETDELKKRLPVLRKDYETLHTRMHAIYDKIKEYEKKEEGLREVERRIEEKGQALKQAQARLREAEERIKSKGFSDYLATEMKEEHIVSPEIEEKDLIKETHLEVYNMIDECKSFIRTNNLGAARNAYMQLRDIYNSVKAKGTEKDLLYNSIRELYDDIKLAEMSKQGL